jgi:hypothetical protein
MTPEHLDTLVGIRSPLHQKLYDVILEVATKYNDDFTLVFEEFHIERDIHDENVIYIVKYKNTTVWMYQVNIISIFKRSTDYMSSFADFKCIGADYMSLDEKCRLILYPNNNLTYQGWEI